MMKKSKRIGEQLIRSIEESRFYIIVFSKNYASSSWCLEELVKMMEHTAYPVFFDVEPSEVRHAVGEAIAKLVVKGKGKRKRMWIWIMEMMWQNALKEAAGLAGWELKNTVDGHESKFIQNIVKVISLKLHSVSLRVDPNLVGMETRVKNVISSLKMDIKDVRVIGIKGMGGGGKTTLARAVFDDISVSFDGKSFVDNVREVSKGSTTGLAKLQKQVLKDILNNQNIDVTSIYEGKYLMKEKMCDQTALIVLDDVDDTEQLEALVGELSWFKKGSRIIVTTRDQQVLVAQGVNSIHDISLLSHEEAICLFSRYAFKREIPNQRMMISLKKLYIMLLVFP
ncbi:disease resistance protein Roq1-like [Bidens hawaiensis]|uniref:disease resistance protein Roq1-like n=1 Tax=Bidens hawaiensis TaxID=980011 RepID=UPI00404A8C2D